MISDANGSPATFHSIRWPSGPDSSKFPPIITKPANKSAISGYVENNKPALVRGPIANSVTSPGYVRMVFAKKSTAWFSGKFV